MNGEKKIPPGYKKTEIGIIPEDWEVDSFTTYADLKHGFQFREEHFSKNGIVVIKIGNLIDGTSIDTINVSFIPKKDFKKFSRYTLKKGDVLMALTGATLGKVSIVNTKKTILQNYRVGNFLPKDNISKKYIYYILQSKYIQKKITRLINEAAQPNLGKKDFDKFKIPMPKSPEEQRAIARVLSDFDNLIESLDKLIEKKKMIKKGTMQLLLTGKKRLPGFYGEWIKKKLGEIGTITGAGVDKKIRKSEEPIRLLNYMDVYKKDFLHDKDISFWTTAPKNKIEQCSVKKGDVFFTPSSELQTDIALSAVAMEDMNNVVYSYHLVRFRLKEDWNLKFRTYIFKTRYFLNQAEKFAEGSGKRYVISLKKFREFEIYYPIDLAEQRTIAQILSDMDSEIEALKKKKKKYEMMKKGAMELLLTGKVRIKEINLKKSNKK